MRVARLHGPRDVRLHDEPRPAPGDGEVLVRVEAVGICGSDLHWFDEGSIGGVPLTRPLSPGHELAGTTEDGRRVAVEPAIPCDACSLCLEGHPNLCPSVRFAGYAEDDGALREWMAWPERCLFPLPDSPLRRRRRDARAARGGAARGGPRPPSPGHDRRRLRVRPHRTPRPAGRAARGGHASDRVPTCRPGRTGSRRRGRSAPRRSRRTRAARPGRSRSSPADAASTPRSRRRARTRPSTRPSTRCAPAPGSSSPASPPRSGSPSSPHPPGGRD